LLRLQERGRRPGLTAEQAEAAQKQLSQQVSQLDQMVKRLEDRYLLSSAGRPPLERIRFALRATDPEDRRRPPPEVRLAVRALEALQAEKPPSPQNLAVQLNLLFLTGRVQEVRQILDERDAQGQPAWAPKLGPDPDTGLPAYPWGLVRLGAALGEYDV